MPRQGASNDGLRLDEAREMMRPGTGRGLIWEERHLSPNPGGASNDGFSGETTP